MKNTIYVMLILLPMFSISQGSSEGYVNQPGYGITSAGQGAGKGSYGSTIFGYNASSLSRGYSNAIFGSAAGYGNTGTAVVLIGSNAGRSNNGSNNTFVGNSSGYQNRYGSNNTFLGSNSGFKNVYGRGNVFIGYQAGYGVTESHRLYIENSNAKVPLIYGEFDTNKVGVNTNAVPTGYTFAVNGKTIAEEVKVKLYASWPDYVFNKAYKLPSLQEVEKHITEKGHLHNIPTAETVKENGGFLLGEMNIKLLEKVEELTLYTIAQEKEISSHKVKVLQVQEQNEALEARIAKLETKINALLKE